MIEAQRAVAYVYDTLKADATFNAAIGGRLYRDQVPQAATLPAGIVSLVSSTDSMTLGADRVFAVALIDVHLIGAGSSYAPINAAADRADAVLSNSVGSSGGVHVVELRREQVQAFLEVDAGTTFSHLICTFRSECHSI